MTEEKFTTKLLTQEELDTFSAYASAPIEQTSGWSIFQNQSAGRISHGHIGVYKSSKLVAIALPVEINSGKYTYNWIKNGPVLAEGVGLDDILPALTKEVKKSYPKSLFLRFNTLHKTMAVPSFGFHIKKTIELDTKPTAEEVVEQMPKKKVRYVGRRAISDKDLLVDIQNGESENIKTAIDDFYQLWQTTAKYQGFGIHPKSYIESMFSGLGKNCYLVSVKDCDGLVLSGAIATYWGGKAVYYYGARRNHDKSDDASMRSVIEAITYANSQGASSFDMLGVSESDGDRLAGVTTFKRKFSINVVDYPAAYDIPLKALQYKALRKAYKIIKKH